ncbi:MAG TPA: hypothetical protein VF548_13070 [Allosphingosinicella sp.]|jgi:hypothetical protein
MPSSGPPRALALTLSLVLAALLFYAFLWPRAAWVFVSDQDRAVVERALASAAASFSGDTAEDFRWKSRPVVVRSAGRVCVTLAVTRPYHGYSACYDARTGETIEERAWVV